MKLISFSLTTAAVRDGSKTVTRRLGWWNLKPGEQIMACEKVMGRRKGEPLVRIRVIEIVSAKGEPLHAIHIRGVEEVRREGFADTSTLDFVQFFCRAHRAKGCEPATRVNRIVFKYVGDCLPAK